MLLLVVVLGEGRRGEDVGEAAGFLVGDGGVRGW